MAWRARASARWRRVAVSATAVSVVARAAWGGLRSLAGGEGFAALLPAPAGHADALHRKNRQRQNAQHQCHRRGKAQQQILGGFGWFGHNRWCLNAGLSGGHQLFGGGAGFGGFGRGRGRRGWAGWCRRVRGAWQRPLRRAGCRAGRSRSGLFPGPPGAASGRGRGGGRASFSASAQWPWPGHPGGRHCPFFLLLRCWFSPQSARTAANTP